MKSGRYLVFVLALVIPLAMGVKSAAKKGVPAPSLVTCELHCEDGEDIGCAIGEHDAWNSDLYRDSMRRGGSHPLGQPCWEGSCEDMHDKGQCIIWVAEPLITSGEVDKLRTALAQRDIRQVGMLVAAHPHQILINSERAAVQVVRCSGTVIASIPVPRQLINSLARSESSEVSLSTR
jgi:hypothetical protein